MAWKLSQTIAEGVFFRTPRSEIVNQALIIAGGDLIRVRTCRLINS